MMNDDTLHMVYIVYSMRLCDVSNIIYDMCANIYHMRCMMNMNMTNIISYY